MKKTTFIGFGIVLLAACFGFSDCDNGNKTAQQEQAHIEQNQAQLNQVQPSPTITWSLERDNLIKRFKLMNDRGTNFFMYVFIEGVPEPIGYYQVNKVSSVNSQLTATQQIVFAGAGAETAQVLESPAEDGSYGTNGDAVFGFTPEDIYVEHNMKYIVSTVPLTFAKAVQRLAVINSDEAKSMLEKSKQAMAK